MAHFLGADIGTTNVKGILVDEHERIVSAASRPLQTERPKVNWSEQSPQAWWSAFLEVCGTLQRGSPRAWRDVASIGLTGQMHAAVCLDAGGRPLRRAILWNDGRAQAECAELLSNVSNLREIAGVLPMAGFTAPKILWLKRHEPRVFARIVKIVSAKDFVRLKLTGDIVTDMSDAAGTLWLDERTRQFSLSILASCDLSPAQMPLLAEGTVNTGTLSPSAANRLKLGKGVIVAAGGGDVAAGAVGIGAVEEGDSFVSLGTSAQYFIARNRYEPNADPTVHAFAHCLPGRWYHMAALLNGASCLEWVCRLLKLDIDEALAEVGRRAKSPSPVLFMPYLAGERTPHNDPGMRGAFLHLGQATARHELVQAVLEGVALSLADVRERLHGSLAKQQTLAVIGGGARSVVWMRILSDVLGRELVLYRTAETAAPFGATRLARMALTRESARSVCRKPQVSSRIHPRPEWHEKYAGLLETFRHSAEIARMRPNSGPTEGQVHQDKI